MFIIRGVSLWIACLTLCAVILANWLLLEYPGVYPEMFASNAGCAQSVIVTSGVGMLLTCLYMGAATDYFGLKKEIGCKVIRAPPNLTLTLTLTLTLSNPNLNPRPLARYYIDLVEPCPNLTLTWLWP